MSDLTKTAAIERELQYVNYSFGAAFGGYVGIVLATKEISDSAMINMFLLLGSVSVWLSHFHETAIAIVRGGYRDNWKFIAVSTLIVFGLQFQSVLVGEIYTVSVRLFGAWYIVLLVTLFRTRLMMSREND